LCTGLSVIFVRLLSSYSPANGCWSAGGVWDDIHPVRMDKHIAMFPLELPRRLIKMYSFWGETILDPFLGSGTTSAAAALMGRNSVGYEINPDFEEVIADKIRKDGGEGEKEIAVVRREAG